MAAPLRATILVADDHAAAREKASRLLLDAGYRVDLASSGSDAIERLRREPFDLALLDLMMPGVSGLEVLRFLRASKTEPYLPVILLSSKGDPEQAAQALRLGADDFLAKPYEGIELLARIEAR